MSRYSEERKQAILSKLSPPHNLSVSEVARSEGIGVQTLYNWRKEAREQGQPMPGNKNTPDNWSSEAKLATIIEVSGLSETELSEYCRSKGLYVEQIKALFGKPDYSHIVRDTTATISITAAEMAAKWPLRGCTPPPPFG